MLIDNLDRIPIRQSYPKSVKTSSELELYGLSGLFSAVPSSPVGRL